MTGIFGAAAAGSGVGTGGGSGGTGGSTGGGGGTTPSALKVTLNTTTASGESVISSTVTSNTVTGTVSGGTKPYVSYVWTRRSGSASIVPLSPNSPSTAFQGTGIAKGQTLTATFDLTATDSGAPAQVKSSSVVTVDLTHSQGDTGTL